MKKEDYDGPPLSTPIRQNVIPTAIQQFLKIYKAQFLWLSLFVVTVVIITLWVSPRVLSLYYEEKGGKLLAEALDNTGGGISAFNCIQGPLDDNTVREKADEGILTLKMAVQYNQFLSHAYLLLGRAYCSLGQPEDAIEQYRKYISLRPNDPLGHMELGLAYLLSCETKNKIRGLNTDWMFNSHNNICNSTEYRTHITEEWNREGIGTEQVLSEGDNAFTKKEYQTAAIWYQAGNILGRNLSQPQIFKWAIAAVLSGYPIPEHPDPQAVVVYSLNRSLQIEARDLQWMNEFPQTRVHYGDPLSKFLGPDQTSGILWWAGTAVAFVNVAEPGNYRIIVRAKDTPPGPIQLQIENNLSPIHLFTLQTGNNTWNNLEQDIYLSSGIHLIGIHFLKDNGDATIEYIRFEDKT